MTKPRLVIVALALYTVILGALAAMGSSLAATIFYAALIIQIIIHTVWICPRCINMYCAVNPNSPHYILGPRKGAPPANAKPMSQTLGVLLLGVTFIIGLIGVWLFNQLVWMFMAIAGGLLFYGYSRVSCRHCVNKCPMNPAAGAARQ